ncbi:LOW QUALITY PROTEIN: putative exported protein [Psychrobacter sp. JCM 18901]|nr:LOW QUALITY PROTEIN: putative exported protein [Psychrobacter sp. JCM 18901]
MIKIVSIAVLAVAVSSCASIDTLLNKTNSTGAMTDTITSINAEKGLVTLQSNHSVQDTADKLVSVIESKGMKVFARVDHQKNAQSADLSLRPTQVVMFGNPKAGTPLMNCEQTVAIDLPQKNLNRRCEKKVWLSYNDPQYLKTRHNIKGCDTEIANISKALNAISTAATAK